MKHYWLCNDVQGFMACANCLRNPEHKTNTEAAMDKHQRWDRPLTSRRGCADQMTAGAGYAEADHA